MRWIFPQQRLASRVSEPFDLELIVYIKGCFLLVMQPVISSIFIFGN